jgi:hypothetical protein
MPQKEQFCPLCGKLMKQQNTRDTFGHPPVVWCPTPIPFQGGKQKFHFQYDPNLNVYVMIVPPYRITTDSKITKIAIHISPDHPKATPAYKDGTWLFKNITTCPRILPIQQDKLLKKIQTLVLFS